MEIIYCTGLFAVHCQMKKLINVLTVCGFPGENVVNYCDRKVQYSGRRDGRQHVERSW